MQHSREVNFELRSVKGARSTSAASFSTSVLHALRIDDALIQPYSGHATRQSLETYSRLALAADAQQR